MRRINTRGLVAAMENEEVVKNDPAPAVVDNTQDIEVAEAATELTDQLADVSESVAEGEAAEAQVEEATEVAEALEALAEQVGIVAANGGLDRHAAGALQIAVEHMYNRVGISDQNMPALESFGGTSQKIGATQLAMEDIKEQAAKIWAAIVAAVKKAIAWAEELFNKCFDGATKLGNRAAALKTKVEAISGEAETKAFENEGLVKKLHVGDKVDAGFVAAYANMAEVALEIFADTHSLSSAVGEEVIDNIEKMLASDKADEKMANFTIPAHSAPKYGKELSNPEAAGFAAPAEGLTVYRSEELPGGSAVVSRGPKTELKGEAAVTAVTGIGSKVEPFDGSKTKAPTVKEVPTLSAADMAKVCDISTEISKALLAYKAGAAKIKEMKKKFVAAAEKAAKAASTAEGEAKAGFQALQKVAAKLPSFLDQPAASFAVYSLNTAKAALDYVDHSAKQYGAKAAEAAPEAEKTTEATAA